MSQGSGSNWFRFLSRWGLVSGVIYLVMIALFMSLLFSVGADLGLEEAELTAAANRPVAHSVAALLDALVWIGLGGMLLGFAGLAISGTAASRRASNLDAGKGLPVRAALLLACAVGQLSGAVGGFVRLYAGRLHGSRLGEAAGEGAQQVIADYLAVWSLVSAHFALGELLGSVGLLLVASVVLALGLPRWLAVFSALLGAYGIANQLAFVFSGDFLPLFMPHTLGLIALHFVLAALFWRPGPASEPESPRHAPA